MRVTEIPEASASIHVESSRNSLVSVEDVYDDRSDPEPVEWLAQLSMPRLSNIDVSDIPTVTAYPPNYYLMNMRLIRF